MTPRPTIALVLAGGGARGAYEMGVLSVLLPELERRGERPTLVLGTSVGALNAAFLAAAAHRPAAEAVEEGTRIWREIQHEDVLSGIVSLGGLRRLGAYAGGLAGLPARTAALLDPAPLAATVARSIAFDRLEENARAALVDAAVVATSASTSRSVVFHTRGRSPARDDKRGIDYVRTTLARDHVLASSAIPVAFPAVRIDAPEDAAGWYFDGGTRLNVPIKPALALGADRVVVIGLNCIAGRGTRPHDRRPDIAEGASQIVQAMLVDPLVNDVQTLASGNRGGQGDRRPVPYIFVAPRSVDAIGEIAADVYNRHFSGPRALLRSRDAALLGRLLSGGKDAAHGELLSYLFFVPELTRALLDHGRRDGERWLAARHDDGPWRIETPPPPARPDP